MLARSNRIDLWTTRRGRIRTMKTAIALILSLSIGFTVGRYTSPRANNEDGLIQVIGTQQAELDVARELIQTLEREREELGAVTAPFL